MTPQQALRHHVTGAIERGETVSIVEQAPTDPVTETQRAIHQAYRDFREADARWSNDLRLAFGKDAGDKRYTKAGETHPFCVSSYQEFRRTNDRWLQLVTTR